MDFERLLFRGKMGDENSIEQILEIYQPLLIKNAMINGVLDEDLYQELVVETLKCIWHFNKIE